ncbi:MAG: type II toxin-antitoxin system HicA family toxin [Bryobacteraceae bacterium]|nr:type II toxin-antitoxin system HicA family toxin [Bryobacteraceae bacterium]
MTGRLPALKSKAVLQALQRGGFFIHHSSGGHYVLKHPRQPEVRVTVPFHNRDLKRGTVQSILRQAGLTAEEFLKLC